MLAVVSVESMQEVLEELDRKFQILIHHNTQSDESENVKELIIKLRYLKKIQEIISSTDL